jgi:flagellin-like hook-associated protein FlgL
VNLDLQETINDLEAVDVAEVVTRLTEQQTVLQITLGVSSQLLSLDLFQFLS